MKATELRIGNILNVAGNNWHVNSVIKLKGDEFELYFDENEEYNHALNSTPIELTEDWLLRFGFHKWGVDDMPSTVSFELALLNIQYSKNTNCYGWLFEKREENNSLSWYPKVEIKYVHSLQNIYHALTGNELTLTTPTP